MLSVRKAAQLRGLEPSTIRLWLAQNRLTYYKIGRKCLRIPESEIERLLHEGIVPRQNHRAQPKPQEERARP